MVSTASDRFLQSVGRLGDGQRAAAHVLGDRADHLPELPGRLSGHDDERTAEPGPLPPLPGQGRQEPVQPWAGEKSVRLSRVQLLRAGAAAAHRLDAVLRVRQARRARATAAARQLSVRLSSGRQRARGRTGRRSSTAAR